MYGYHVIGSSINLRSRSQPDSLVKHEHFLAHWGNNFCQRRPINHPGACLSPAISSSEFPSVQRVGSLGGGTSQHPGIVGSMNRRITTMLSILSTHSFLYTTLEFIYSTLIHNSDSHSFNFFVLITRYL